jgi:hypothetical protein
MVDVFGVVVISSIISSMFSWITGFSIDSLRAYVDHRFAHLVEQEDGG